MDRRKTEIQPTGFCTTLKSHKVLHSKKLSLRFKCPESESGSSCSFSAATAGHLKQHYEHIHARSKAKNRPLAFSCPTATCKFRGESKPHLMKHIKKSHPDFPLVKCSLCPFQTTKTEYLTRHNKIVHLKERKHECSHDNCNYAATTSCNLAKHERTHLKEEDRRFPCPHSDSGCTKRFNQMTTLRVHERVHTQDRNYPCSLCSYKGGSSGNLRAHMTKHTKEKSIKCKLCNFSTAHDGNLTQHIRRIHVREKQFWCQESNCESSFVSKAELQSHQTIHTGEKNYKCAECHKSFSVAPNLARHVRTVHRAEGEKPRRKCQFPGCSYRCDDNGSMKSHVQSRHSNQRPFSCQLCEYRCKLKNNLKIHKNQVHAKNKKWKRKPNQQRYGYNIQQCTSCRFSTIGYAKLALHFSTAHQLPKVNLSRVSSLELMHDE